MTARGSKPLPWRAKGLTDSLDGSTSFQGAMALLSNLIPDPTTANLWECRPAAFVKATFPGTSGSPFSSGFSTGFQQGASTTTTISALKIVGNIAYGMAGSLSDSFDHPFAFNLLTGVFLPITGITGTNLPTAQAASGPWTPPIMDLIGSKLVVTHIGFANTAFFFGWFDVSTPTAPVWNASNLTGAITFNVPPTAVAQFNGRAYFIVNVVSQPAVVFSDPLNATNVTNATQVLTFGDNSTLTCFGQLRLYNQLGGIIQALIVFKGVQNTYQVTGDAALSNLALNAMNFATGTLSPLSVCSTPRGVSFMSPEGLRTIDFQANVSDPIGIDGQGVVAPFIYAVQPSRIAVSCNGNLIRCSVQNGLAQGSPNQEFWYDLGRQIWSGPHTFPASVIQPWNNTFIMAAVGVPARLFQSDPVQNANSSFVENGLQLNWGYNTVLLPDDEQLSNFTIQQSTLDVQLNPNSPPITVTVLDQNGSAKDSVSLLTGGAGTFWGQFQWGQAVWGTPFNALAPRRLNWHQPITLSRGQFSASGQSSSGTRLGAWYFSYKPLKYFTDIQAAA